MPPSTKSPAARRLWAWLLSPGHDVWWPVLLGLFVYSPLWRTHFFSDDVDFFIGLVESQARGTLTGWLLVPAGGHFQPLPKTAYWAVDRYFDRQTWPWHVLALSLHGLQTFFVYRALLEVFRERGLVLFLSGLWASSTLYQENLMATNAMDHHMTVTLVLACWSIWLRALPQPRPGLVLPAVACGTLAVGCSSLGVVASAGCVVFLVLCLFQGPSADGPSPSIPGALPTASPRMGKRTLAATGLWFLALLSFLAWTQRGSLGGLDPIAGLSETWHGVSGLMLPRFASRAQRYLLAVTLISLGRHWMRVQWRTVVLGVWIVGFPLWLATSARMEFGHPGSFSRYHHLPLLGLLLLLGSGLRHLPWAWLGQGLARRLAVGAVVAYLLANASATFEHNQEHPTRQAQRSYEDGLGRLLLDYARAHSVRTIAIPDRPTRMPEFPFERSLADVAAYSIRYSQRSAVSLERVRLAPGDRSEFLEWARTQPGGPAVLSWMR